MGIVHADVYESTSGNQFWPYLTAEWSLMWKRMARCTVTFPGLRLKPQRFHVDFLHSKGAHFSWTPIRVGIRGFQRVSWISVSVLDFTYTTWWKPSYIYIRTNKFKIKSCTRTTPCPSLFNLCNKDIQVHRYSFRSVSFTEKKIEINKTELDNFIRTS